MNKTIEKAVQDATPCITGDLSNYIDYRYKYIRLTVEGCRSLSSSGK